MDIYKLIEETRIVPVIVIEDVKDALPLAEALRKGGINIAEVTFRTDAAKASIEKISATYPDMLVGAGTVLTIGQVDEAVKAGAKFIVTPGSNPKVIEYCVKNNITIIPGCANPSNVELALENGINVVKFFPAEQAGGINYIKAISAPYGNVRFMPTGGINPENVGSYLKEKCIIACGGSWMVKKDLIANKQFEEITRLCKEACDIANQ